MKELERLLASDASDFERQLLRAAAADEPAAELRLQMEHALGINAPVATAGGLGKVLSGSSTLGKTLVGGIVALGVAAAVYGGGTFSNTAVDPQADRAVVDEVAQQPPEDLTLRQPSGDEATPHNGATVTTPVELGSETTAPAEAPFVSAGQPAAAPRTAKAKARAAHSSTLREEIQLLDKARSANLAGRPETALQLLRMYDRRFPKGSMRQEAAVLRVEATKNSGNAGRADELGRKFLEQHPESPHTERVEQITQTK